MIPPKVNDNKLQAFIILSIVTDGEDYRRDTTRVTIPANNTSTSVTINIINDDISECNESFKLMLDIPSSTCGVVIGNNDIAEVVIKDNDSKRVFTVIVLCYLCTDQQWQCCHLINHNILLKRTLLHYQLV